MKFNIRVYGLLIHNDKILVSDENRFGMQFTKFPGGGLEFQEGVIDCLKREFKEELNIEIQNPQLFYINENYVPSAFNSSHQLLSIYYLVESDEISKIELKEKTFDFNGQEQVFRMLALNKIEESSFKFPVDREVVKKLLDFK